MWYNEKARILQTVPPWGNGFLLPEIAAERYPSWQEVPDDFVLPAPVPTKAQRIAALNAEYTAYDAELLKYWTAAAAEGDTETQADIQAEREAVRADYMAQVDAIRAEGGE
jgi:hypothetical protein